MPIQQILLIDVDGALSEVLARELETEGCDVARAASGREGIRKATALLPHLIVLDLALPDMDGLDVCRQIRTHPQLRDSRILIVTTRQSEWDEVAAFQSGADDYVIQPCRLQPLVHRIKALIRRSQAAPEGSNVLIAHGVEIDRSRYIAKAFGNELKLTPTEFRLLWIMAQVPGQSFGRLELVSYCRGDNANTDARTIDVHVRSLRHKLDRHADLIETVRGVGYRFRPLTFDTHEFHGGNRLL